MATLTFLRLSQAHKAVVRMSGPLMMRHVTPLAASTVQTKTLMVTPRRDKRIYGPASPNGPSVTSHWKSERVLAIGLIPLIPAAFMFPVTAMDYAISAAMVLHCHWSWDGVITDYLHNDSLKSVAKPLVLLCSIAAFGGLCFFNYNDVGIIKAVTLFFTQL